MFQKNFEIDCKVMKPLLSICIPTYNRSSYLRNTLDSIVKQDGFSEEVEIVISDNASTDRTPDVAKEYTDKYSNIHYFRNQENIRDQNFPTVLSEAQGVFRKLNNDTLLFNDGSVKYLLKLIKENMNEKPVFFFMNDGKADNTCLSVSDFLQDVSFNITYIGALSVWGDICTKERLGTYGCDKNLWQVPFLLSYVNASQKIVVEHKSLFTNQQIEKKDISYGLYNVFYTNYLGFIRDAQDKNYISQDDFDWCEKDLLFNFFSKWILIQQTQSENFKMNKSEDLYSLVEETYADKPYWKIFKKEYRKKKNIYNIKAVIKAVLR